MKALHERMIKPLTFKFTTVTIEQKFLAMKLRYYDNQEWSPYVGDYYTSTRDDFELYKIIGTSYDNYLTQYCDPLKQSDQPGYWNQKQFTTHGFGEKRLWIPNWILFPESPDRWHDIDNPERDPYRYFYKQQP